MSDDNRGTELVLQSNEPNLPSARVIRSGTPVAAFVPQTFADAMKIARVIAQSGMAPKSYGNDEAKVLVGMMTGAEVGLTPMQSLRGIAVIGNQPQLWGDVALAVVMSSGLLEDFVETQEGDFDDLNKGDGVAICVMKRRGYPTPVNIEFGMQDARRAGLLNKAGPWRDGYRPRMCQMRARGFAMRDLFADVLSGLNIAHAEDDAPTLIEAGARRAVRDTVAATVTDLEHQSEERTVEQKIDGHATGELVSLRAGSPAAEAEPVKPRRQRVRSPKPDDAKPADQAPAKRPATPEDRANLAMYRSLLADYATEKELADREGNEKRLDEVSIQSANIEAAVAKLEAEANFDVDEDGGVPIVGNGYDLNKHDGPEESTPGTLDGHLAAIKAKELLSDIVAYRAEGLSQSDAMIFESERAKVVARRKAEARQGR